MDIGDGLQLTGIIGLAALGTMLLVVGALGSGIVGGDGSVVLAALPNGRMKISLDWSRQ